MNIEFSNNYTEQFMAPFIDVAETGSMKKSKKKWTDDEDAQLKGYIKEYGENWKKIAENMPGKTHRQCEVHWTGVLDPTIKHGKWSEEENEKLKKLIDQQGEKWTKIAQEIPGRTALQCRQHYRRALSPTIKQKEWTQEEQLQGLVDKQGAKCVEIAKQITGRTDLQCMAHYQRSLNFSINNKKGLSTDLTKRKKWTEEEDDRLKKLIDQHGENWVEIAKEMPGRTNNHCWQRYKLSLNPTIKQGRWTTRENDQLEDLIDQYGENWAEIAKHIPGRTYLQCRQHYNYNKSLSSVIKQNAWSEEEDNQLRETVQRIGEGQWDLIAKDFSNRTNIQCARRWQILNPTSHSNKKQPRSETHFSIEERPLKKIKKTHSPQVVEEEGDLDESEVPLTRPSTQSDQHQPTSSDELISPQLEQPQTVLFSNSDFNQSLPAESFLSEENPFPMEQNWIPEQLEEISPCWIEETFK